MKRLLYSRQSARRRKGRDNPRPLRLRRVAMAAAGGQTTPLPRYFQWLAALGSQAQTVLP
jgi:hypothetical protein